MERISSVQSFLDNGRVRNPYPNVLNADLCVIYYGTNDFTFDAPARSDNSLKTSDTPTRPEDAKTIKGGAYYMVNKLYELNPRIKILILPPTYRRSWDHFVYDMKNPNEIYNTVTGGKLTDYGVALKEVSEEQGAKFIDWYPVFNYENFAISDQYTVDGLHPNREGHQAMFDYLIAHK